jgi:hypothetical protein
MKHILYPKQFFLQYFEIIMRKETNSKKCYTMCVSKLKYSVINNSLWNTHEDCQSPLFLTIIKWSSLLPEFMDLHIYKYNHTFN